MEIKTYRAGSVHEALQMVRYDLGPDAVVLGTREVHAGSLLGLLSGRRCWELKASADSSVVGHWPQLAGRLDQGIDLSQLGASSSCSTSD